MREECCRGRPWASVQIQTPGEIPGFFVGPNPKQAAGKEEIMKELWNNVTEHAGYVCGFLAIIAGLFVLAAVLDRLSAKKRGDTDPVFSTRKVTMIGMFSALAGVLMLFEIPLPFAPSFYKLDFSELPILIGGFAFGPTAAVMMEFLKILLKLLLKGTSTAFVGELANFAVGCSLVLPASVIYGFRKTRTSALVSLLAGTFTMTIFGTLFNAVYLLPAFSALYGIPMEVLLEMGAAVNPLAGGGLYSFVFACVAPLNLIKGLLDGAVTLLVYKKISPLIKGNSKHERLQTIA